jgi:hypothetical protein
MLVFAFDRDWTVDVNPHPRHDAVPLVWVRHLAHETPHAVYAIGNQTLAEEAAIPGVVDIVGRHPDDWDEWLGEKQPDGRYEQFPLRRGERFISISRGFVNQWPMVGCRPRPELFLRIRRCSPRSSRITPMPQRSNLYSRRMKSRECGCVIQFRSMR